MSRPPSLTGLIHLIQIPSFLSSQEISFCVSALNDVLISPDSDDTYDTTLDGLVLISTLHSRTLEAETLPLLFASLPTEAPTLGTKENEAYRRALSSLAALCVHPDLFEVLSLRLLSRLEGILSTPTSTTTPSASLYAHHLLATLRAVLGVKVTAGHQDVGRYVEKFVPRLLGMFILPTLGEEEVVAKDSRLLSDAGKVVNAVVQRVDVEYVFV